MTDNLAMRIPVMQAFLNATHAEVEEITLATDCNGDLVAEANGKARDVTSWCGEPEPLAPQPLADFGATTLHPWEFDAIVRGLPRRVSHE